jgi:hypothetical protein
MGTYGLQPAETFKYRLKDKSSTLRQHAVPGEILDDASNFRISMHVMVDELVDRKAYCSLAAGHSKA